MTKFQYPTCSTCSTRYFQPIAVARVPYPLPGGTASLYWVRGTIYRAGQRLSFIRRQKTSECLSPPRPPSPSPGVGGRQLVGGQWDVGLLVCTYGRGMRKQSEPCLPSLLQCNFINGLPPRVDLPARAITGPSSSLSILALFVAGTTPLHNRESLPFVIEPSHLG